MGRVREAAWPVAQAAVAAGIAWTLAQVVLGHPQPVFAPSAAVVALAASVGGRGTQAAEMLLGVAVGVVAGEGLVLVLGAGAPEVALASSAAMLVMAAVEISPLPLIQAGSSAVLVVALQIPSSGAGRMLDALVGGVVALLFRQILFPPSPVSLLKDAGRRALDSVAFRERPGPRGRRRRGRCRDKAPARRESEHDLRPRRGPGEEREGRPPDAPRQSGGEPARTPRRPRRRSGPPLRKRRRTSTLEGTQTGSLVGLKVKRRVRNVGS